MKRSLLLALPLLSAQLAFAQTNIPGSISYQGRVSDASGALIGDVTPVNRTVTLRIYGSPTGTDVLYSEQQVVTISKGQFSVLLGTGLLVGSEPHPAVVDALNGVDRFLGITVDDGTPTADPEISPRQQLVSTAFAMRAMKAENSARTDFATTAGTAQHVQAAANDTSNFNWINASNLTVDGHSKITGGNVLEFGVGSPKGADSGIISYDTNNHVLNIIGARSTAGEGREITLWAEGGTNLTGPINFGSRLGQHINLWGTTYGIGIQGSTLYNRVDAGGQFVWYKSGSHVDAVGDSGGGQTLAVLNGGGLSVNSGGVHVNAGGLHINDGGISVNSGNIAIPNGALDHGGHGVFAQSFGGGHSVGSQNYVSFFRTAPASANFDDNGSFNFYAGGSYTNPGTGRSDDAGGGTHIMHLDNNGIYLGGRSVRLGANHYASGEDPNAYMIAAHQFSDGLDIIGGGTASFFGNPISTRKVKVWAEHGAEFTGTIIVNGNNYGYNIPANSDDYRSTGGANLAAQNVGNVSIDAGRGRVVADSFTAVSDARLKKISGVSDAARDLETLRKVQITDYTKKEDESASPRGFKKVIAQQIEAVFPQAVSTMKGAVPDLLTTVSAKGGLITLTKPLPAQVKKGDVLKVWRPNAKAGGTDSALTKITAVTKSGFEIEDKLDGRIFLFGHQVDDLRAVDYEAISMLNVSATQELSRMIEKQAAEIKKLEEEKATLATELAAATAANKAQDTRLAAIEKALKLEQPAVGTGEKKVATAGR